MAVFSKLILLPVCIVAFLIDVAIFFLIIRLLTYILPARALLFLDRIGGAGVDVVTGRTISHHVRRWSTRPLSHRQEEAVAVFVLIVIRGVLGLVITIAGAR